MLGLTAVESQGCTKLLLRLWRVGYPRGQSPLQTLFGTGSDPLFARRINEIVLGKRGVTADTALQLAVALGTSECFWLGLQADYDLEEARRALGNDAKRIERIAA